METNAICIVEQIMLERLAKDDLLQNVLTFEWNESCVTF